MPRQNHPDITRTERTKPSPGDPDKTPDKTPVLRGFWGVLSRDPDITQTSRTKPNQEERSGSDSPPHISPNKRATAVVPFRRNREPDGDQNI